jgi:hypothetical protein
MMEKPLITEEDITEMANFPTLGPGWAASRRVAEKILGDWSEDGFKKIIDKTVYEIGARLWDDVRNSLQDDMESNIAGYIRAMVDETVNALLTGQTWAMERYPLSQLYQGDVIRAAIASHIPVELLDARIADLEEKNKTMADAIEVYRG